MYDVIVIHYSEIGLKGKNREFFEQRLMGNIRKALGKNVKKVYRRYGRIVCELTDKIETEKVKNTLALLPGVSNFAFAKRVELDIEKIKRSAIALLKQRKFETFKIEASRSNKKFLLTSRQINEIVGDSVVKELEKKVNLTNPDITAYIEVSEKEAFVYCDKHRGISGLPVSTSGKVIASLSGGIDSPVASFLMMKRGCEVIFVHIFNKTMAGRSVLTKIYKIVEQLTKIQLKSKLYIVPFEKIQKEIIVNVPAKYRMIVYRRFMMRILNIIARKERALGIVTGDNLGQVASQTLENLNCIYEVSTLPVFTPLIGMNKEETIKLAKKIGTYEYSIMPYPDCCSFMIAKHPETRARLEVIDEVEKRLKGIDNLLVEAVKKAEVRRFEIVGI